ncbi:aminoglycoside phosphotransferase family protein [Kribbella deserti]|uniref:Aminoglycoside phosphotransferase family protein n=1 Tax=Kribbella deserti TaxID=1926257 RepID=A0ABV6QWC5_9ACTN
MVPSIDVPDALAASHRDEAGRAWLAALPGRAAALIDRWSLRPDGPAAHGMAGLVLPVRRADGTSAVLKLQPPSEDNAGVPLGLRTWNGAGISRLLDHDPASGGLLLERLDGTRPLSSLSDDDEAMQILAGILARLVAVEAPDGLRRLGDIAADMLDQVPAALPALVDPADRELVRTCAAAVTELLDEPGDRLLHWDLHYGNVLAGEREPWLAIDPEPLAGDPGFDLWPALDSNWEVVAAGDVRRTVLRRFDRLTEALGLDRERAVGWTLGRILQNALWDIEDGEAALAPAQAIQARTLLTR